MALKSGWNFTFTRANWQIPCDASNQIPLEEADALLAFFFGNPTESGAVPNIQLVRWNQPEWAEGGTFAGFEKYLEYFKNGRLDSWKNYAEGLLALVIILDQLPRKYYPDTKREFAWDKRARAISDLFVSSGNYKVVSGIAPVKAYYGIIPYMHSEDARDQKTMNDLFPSLLQKAQDDGAANAQFLVTEKITVDAHADAISRFGRFPGRNEVLQRTPTNPEVVALHRGLVMGSRWNARTKTAAGEWALVGPDGKVTVSRQASMQRDGARSPRKSRKEMERDQRRIAHGGKTSKTTTSAKQTHRKGAGAREKAAIRSGKKKVGRKR